MDASQTPKWPQPATIHPCLITALLSKTNRTGRIAAFIRLSCATESIHNNAPLNQGRLPVNYLERTLPPDGREFSRRSCAMLAAASAVGAGAYTTPDAAAQTDI